MEKKLVLLTTNKYALYDYKKYGVLFIVMCRFNGIQRVVYGVGICFSQIMHYDTLLGAFK